MKNAPIVDARRRGVVAGFCTSGAMKMNIVRGHGKEHTGQTVRVTLGRDHSLRGIAARRLLARAAAQCVLSWKPSSWAPPYSPASTDGSRAKTSFGQHARNLQLGAPPTAQRRPMAASHNSDILFGSAHLGRARLELKPSKISIPEQRQGGC